MNKSKMLVVPEEFDEILNRQLKMLMEDCRALGINKKKIPKTKALKLLAKRMTEDEARGYKSSVNLRLL